MLWFRLRFASGRAVPLSLWARVSALLSLRSPGRPSGTLGNLAEQGRRCLGLRSPLLPPSCPPWVLQRAGAVLSAGQGPAGVRAGVRRLRGVLASPEQQGESRSGHTSPACCPPLSSVRIGRSSLWGSGPSATCFSAVPWDWDAHGRDLPRAAPDLTGFPSASRHSDPSKGRRPCKLTLDLSLASDEIKTRLI